MQAPRWWRRRSSVVVVGALALALAGSVVVRLAGDTGDDASDPVVSPTPTQALGSTGTARQSATPDARDSGLLAVRYRFDGGVSGSVTDEAGLLPLRAASASGGELSTQAHNGGLAVRFPRPCATYGDKDCARAILESGPADLLNPGTRPLRYGAAVRLAREEATKGANVLQKGYSQGDSQYKLQIDGAEGRPSCVLVGIGSTRINIVTSSLSVADGQWHAVECVRNGTSLTIVVDGGTRGQINISAELSIVNKEPFRVGGKGTSPNNDQFAGAIDDAFVIIGA
jgi:hypothetical protein